MKRMTEELGLCIKSYHKLHKKLPTEIPYMIHRGILLLLFGSKQFPCNPEFEIENVLDALREAFENIIAKMKLDRICSQIWDTKKHIVINIESVH